jgi:eukaryotic-like serine/threonine-protein kinase
MGEVYKAHDTRLGRTVALKVLAPRFAGDDVRRKRFLREAKAISLLSHPRICSLYDLGSEGGEQFLVMEYIEGETLAQRLTRGPLTLDDALRYSIDIASALEAAHKRGIVHRDLKPANVMLAADGAKLFDFGLASLSEGDGTSAEALTSDMSMIGTMEYMAPEQLNGEPADARTDIFAFGVMLFEMVTGERPFQGVTRANLLSAILLQEPRSILELDPTLPAGLDRLLRATLAKRRDDRVQTAHDLALQLEWLREGSNSTSRPRKRRPRAAVRGVIGAGLVAAIAAGAAGTAGWFASHQDTRSANEVRFELSSPTAAAEVTWSAVSPDGRRIAFVTETSDAHRTLWVRELASTNARPVIEAEAVLEPFWSPASDAIAYFDLRRLNVIQLQSNRPQVLAEADAPRGGAWSSNGTILYTPHVSNGLYAIPSSGGSRVQVTRLDARLGDGTHRWPEFLPDGERFVFVIGSSNPDRAGLYLGSLKEGILRKISDTTNRAVVTSDGGLLTVQSGKLYRQQFELDEGVLRGQPQLVADDVSVDAALTGGSHISAATNGTLLYMKVPAVENEFLWFDRAGDRLGLAPVPRAQYVNPALSPDGRSLAVSRIDPNTGRNTLWIYDLASGESRRIGADERNVDGPRWSPDGKKLYYSSDRKGHYDVYSVPLDVPGPERLEFESTGLAHLCSVREVGVLIHDRGADGAIQLVLLKKDGTRVRLAGMSLDSGDADLSPDGRWIVFRSSRRGTGAVDVFVQSIDGTDVTVQVSQSGGGHPQWSGDGRELYYIDSERRLTVVKFNGGRLSSPVTMFRLNVGNVGYGAADYATTPDGQRFLVNTRVDSGKRSAITVVLNWRGDRSSA